MARMSSHYTSTRHADAAIARLDERVDGLTADLHGIKKDVGDVRQAISSLAQAIGERNKTQWQPLLTAGALVVAVVTTITSAMGVLAFQPVNQAISENREVVRALPQAFIPRGEIEQRWELSDRRAEWLTHRVEKLESQTTDAFTIKDAISALNERMNRIANELGIGVPGVGIQPRQ